MPSRFWRWTLWVYGAIYAVLLGTTAVATASALAAHPIRVNSSGGLSAVNTPVGWYQAVQALAGLAAALFSPVRRRVQRLVDRRFNRARYNADKTAAVFAARLQDAVDLDAVQDELAGVVHQALEPAHVSLWINERG